MNKLKICGWCMVLLCVTGILLTGCSQDKEENKIKLAGGYYGPMNQYTEHTVYYAKGRYVNCSIQTEDMDEGYLEFGVEGELIEKPLYNVPLEMLHKISSDTKKPIVCGKANSQRERDMIRFSDSWDSPAAIEGGYCLEPTEPWDYKYDYFEIHCCVDEYCAIYDYSVRETIMCDCDDSLNIDFDPVQVVCSNLKEEYPNCYEEG